MRKIIAAINMTLDGFCDHTAGIADDELHQHFSELLKNAGVILYGRITFQLMEYWKEVLENPTGNTATDEFAVRMDKVPKLVFSRTLKNTGWHSATLATRSLEEEVLLLREQPGPPVYIGSPSLIASLTRQGLIDEYQLTVHPVILGKGLTLFKDITDQIMLKLLKTETFKSGVVTLYYEKGGI